MPEPTMAMRRARLGVGMGLDSKWLGETLERGFYNGIWCLEMNDG
jgi:hypothetical protein